MPNRKYVQMGISVIVTKAQHVKFQMCISK